MTSDDAGREHWRAVLGGGGLDAIPRWTAAPTQNQGQAQARHRAPINGRAMAALTRVAAAVGVSPAAVLLAAHGRVLASLSSEDDITTGYVGPDGGPPLPCRLDQRADSWRVSLAGAARAESDVTTHRLVPLDDVRRELGVTGLGFDTVLDPHGAGAPEPIDAVVLTVGLSDAAGETELDVRYQTEAFDADAAARIAGYHLRALELMAADLDADPISGGQSLLSADELRFQIDGMAGPKREIPDRRMHELFEDRVLAHPGAIAAVHGDRQLTYRELNGRANRVARAVVARRLPPESVVAVVTDRNLEWMAAVLGIFKAGAVYLPIEPHFPAERIAATLSRSGCTLVLTEQGSMATLDQATRSVPDVETLTIDQAYRDEEDEEDLGLDVAADQLAYIYFTSGSTGEPKGAMCEHAGMLNHMLAKIDDLEIAEGDVVAQIAPQCFDISLWQLVAALLVGGHTLLVEQETILDPERFVERITTGGVGVLQVVPSYLEVLLSYLEHHPTELPDLHAVSATGEALTLELARRWFLAKPSIPLINAYGLTETSDDTNHEVMTEAPSDGSVPLGPPVNNVNVYVTDEELSPVPLGAPGEIVFSGVCVGRGYINDPERTAQVYLDDPLRPGQRLYRSGDFGRWRPDGKLEYLGRRDAQIKIRGFRIEIGDIENALLGQAGVRQGAVVVVEHNDRPKQLVGFWAGDQEEAAVLQDHLGRQLPDYMVPTVLHRQDQLPLSDNGKIDRKALRALADELGIAPAEHEDGHEPPSSAEEQMLADVWAGVLGLPVGQIGRNDDFFDRGGTSLSAVEVVIALDGSASLKEVTGHPVLADLASLIGNGGTQESQLLQALGQPGQGNSDVLICFPYAAGNAVNYRAMARALRSSGMAVYAVELPGHDLAGEAERFAPMDQIIDRVAEEVRQTDPGRLLLWGQSAGAVFALAAALELERRDVAVERVFLGAQLFGDAITRRSAIAELEHRTDAEIATRLQGSGVGGSSDDLGQHQADLIGSAYRHDCLSAHHFVLDAIAAPPAVKLTAPVIVIVAEDDPATTEGRARHGDWGLLADHVDFVELDDGGHHFVQTRPVESAEIVLQTTAAAVH